MTASATSAWKPGDRVAHPSKPEWGGGSVMAASPTLHDGKPCQSVQIRFDRAGVKTISTAFIDLKPFKANPTVRLQSPEQSSDWLTSRDGAKIREVMISLPEAAIDPFGTPSSRLRGTMALYRFTADAGSLVDWAAAQSGLADPLARFNRHELEEFFERFQAARHAQLGKVVSQANQIDSAELAQIAAAAPQAARDAIARSQRRR